MDIADSEPPGRLPARRPVKEGGSMAYGSTRQLKEELARLEEELEAARELEDAAEVRHAWEDAPETEAVLEARRTQAEHLGKQRDKLVGELRRRAVEEEKRRR
jgi:hypothetical protein